MDDLAPPHWRERRDTLPRVLVERAERLGAKPLVSFADDTPPLSYEGLVASARAAACGLARHGCRPGEMAAIFLPNGREFVVAWFASLFAGLSDAPINADFRKTLLSFALETSRPRVLFTDAAGYAALHDEEVVAPWQELRLVVVAGELRPGEAGTGRAPRVISLAELLQEPLSGEAWDRLDGSQLASVRYTSGTTGPAKGAMQSHLHILNKSRLHNQILELGESDVLYSPFPLYHNLASINGLIGVLQAGATLCSATRFSASGYWRDARRGGATLGHVLYPLLPTLLAQPPSDDDRRHAVRYLWMGWPHAEFEARFKTTLIQIYALGEVGAVSYRRGGRDEGATGPPLPEFDVRIVDALDLPVAAGTTGEIVVRPRQPHRVMLGYLNNLPATLRAFRNLWFHTGDAGRLGPDGELHFQGRMGDTIRRRGVNVSSEQVESEVLRHENVRDCAVIGVPSPFGEEDIQACIVWREMPDRLDEAVADLLGFLQERLPRGYVPRYLECLASLPMTETGKVRKPELRNRTTMERRWDREASAWV